MILLILGGLALVLAPIISFCLMLYYSIKQENDIALWEEYEEKIREAFSFGFIITPLIAIITIIMGVVCLNM